jgi:hypothetical protein
LTVSGISPSGARSRWCQAATTARKAAASTYLASRVFVIVPAWCLGLLTWEDDVRGVDLVTRP